MKIRSYTSIADIVSIANVSSGFLSIVMVTTDNFVLAAKFMLIAVIFDALDGWVARKTKREDESGFGKNVDSLSDIISFGVAPGMFLYVLSQLYGISYFNILIPLLIVICGILRLSRFNVITDSMDYKFVGLPIPSTALILSSFYLSGFFNTSLALIIMAVLSLFMISTIKYPKFRGIKTLVAGSILIITTLLPQNILSYIAYFPAKLLFVIMILYLLIVPVIDLYTKFFRSGPNVR